MYGGTLPDMTGLGNVERPGSWEKAVFENEQIEPPDRRWD